MKILNLGCGTKVSAKPNVVNIDWSVMLRMKKNPVFRAVAPMVLKGERRARFESLPDNIMVHNLAKGIPFENGSFDAVYHSHILEHLDREVARGFLAEIKRVLKPGGIVRIVVPDLEKACREYLSHVSVSESDASEAGKHDEFVAAILEQSVRREPSGTSRQRPFRRFVENALLGDARRRGETHQWMYDRINLAAFLEQAGFVSPLIQVYDRSQIPEWGDYGLDQDAQGNEYKLESLYIEARKPA